MKEKSTRCIALNVTGHVTTQNVVTVNHLSIAGTIR